MKNKFLLGDNCYWLSEDKEQVAGSIKYVSPALSANEMPKSIVAISNLGLIREEFFYSESLNNFTTTGGRVLLFAPFKKRKSNSKNKAVEPPLPDNVIRVDFTLKRRAA